ncbi:hypothetical protein [Nesterenkonia flava]|uniref:Uncharacterized protein n=1 Tax=Nesterenkonia flava TaxID=469799 RepID=A0ABU1FTB7_9MICC|nr:hypothetical protein [Nesterenkonia flava]MDR5711423.1 hypothetical protein [Nesterenkonia flava]
MRTPLKLHQWGMIAWAGNKEIAIGPEAPKVQKLAFIAKRIYRRAYGTAPAARFVFAPPKTTKELLVDAIQETTLDGDAMTGRFPEERIAERILERFNVTQGEKHISIPRPRVLHGPDYLTPDQATFMYLHEAADKLEQFHKPFGSNLNAVVVKLLRDAANATDPGDDDD